MSHRGRRLLTERRLSAGTWVQFPLTGVFVEDTGGCVIASTSGEGVLWRGAVFNLILIMSVLLLIPWKRRLK